MAPHLRPRARALQDIEIHGRRDKLLPDIKEAAEALGVKKLVEILEVEIANEVVRSGD